MYIYPRNLPLSALIFNSSFVASLRMFTAASYHLSLASGRIIEDCDLATQSTATTAFPTELAPKSKRRLWQWTDSKGAGTAHHCRSKNDRQWLIDYLDMSGTSVRRSVDVCWSTSRTHRSDSDGSSQLIGRCKNLPLVTLKKEK